MKALGCQPVESTSPFKVLVSHVNLHPYTQGHQLATAKEFYRRAAIWFFVTGLSQALPYFALFGEKDLGKAVQVESSG